MKYEIEDSVGSYQSTGNGQIRTLVSLSMLPMARRYVPVKDVFFPSIPGWLNFSLISRYTID